MLVYAGFVREGILTDDGLVSWRVHTCNARDETRCRIQAGRINSGFDVEKLSPGLDRHDDLFKAAVACTFADTVDRAFNLPRARVNGGQAISDGHAQIIVAVHAQGDLVDARNMLAEITKQFVKFSRHGVADRIGNIDGRCTSLNGGADDLGEVSQLRT